MANLYRALKCAAPPRTAFHPPATPAPEAFSTGPQAPNVFLVTDGGEGALIDSGFGDEQSLRARLEYLRERPDVKVRYIILTHHHFDHTSGAQRLRQATGAQVVMHPPEGGFLLGWHGGAPPAPRGPPPPGR